MPLNFTAIDFETATVDRGSACSVGITKVVNGRVDHTESWFISPPTGSEFTNTHIHGIGPRDVVGAPSWAVTLDRLDTIVDGAPLVAYSPFDKGVYNAANRITGARERDFVFLDALALVRRHVVLDSYRLPLVVEHLGLPGFAHHEAGADSLACAQITLSLARRSGIDDTGQLWQGVTRAKRQSRSWQSQTVAELPHANTAADPEHPLFGEVICFSGDLSGHTRVEAQRLVAQFGATVSAGVTKKTSLVVMGGYDPATLRPGATISTKVQKALDLRAGGQRIEVVPESIFLELVGG